MRAPNEPPFWLPLLAGLPITLCMGVMALPALGEGHAAAYRALYLVAYLVWCLPLTALQRALWRRRTPGWASALVLLVLTYAMSVVNNGLGVLLTRVAGWGLASSFRWTSLFDGLDGCWLALIAFCAIHAVVAYYAELKHEQGRREEALFLARDAELRALRYQLHPHFLFNTLNAVSTLVAEERGREACHMLSRLSEFLRATLDGADHHEVSLADELALTETYLDIERVRLGERLALKWSVGPEVLDALVPYLLLQPLVENAIRHGIALRSQPGRLDIQLMRQGDRLHVRVGNEGVREQVSPTEEDRHPSRVGLRNVSERLAKLYPGNHSLEARPRDDGGYDVALDLPFREVAAA